MPCLVVVCGLPGVGKSTVAAEVVDRLGGRLRRTDAVRKEIRAEPRYDRAESRRVYARIFDEARDDLTAGRNAVLDGTFQRARHREWGRTLADAVDCRFELVRVTCDESAAVERVADRDLDGELSDASLDTYYQIMKSFEEVSLPHVRIDNSRSMASTELQVERWCDQLR
ncbi:MAG: AAA family ATPase [Haloarculaceae archaeon]